MKPDERFYPGDFALPFDSHVRHYERYFMALKLLGRLGKGEVWLDAACGSGYGTNFLSNFATRMVGYDISEEAVSYAKEHSVENCEFCDFLLQGKIRFDAVFSIETIEHVGRGEAGEFLEFLAREMQNEGLLLLSTPIVEISNPNPVNLYHQYEYCLEELDSLLSVSGFTVIEKVLQKRSFTDGETKEQGLFKCAKSK